MRDEGFPPTLRVRRRRDYLEIQREGHKRHTRHFLVFARRRTGECGGLAHARLGITVTRKVGNAVTRNRIKRLVREAFRREPWAGGVEMVWVAKRNAATVTHEEVVEEMRTWAAGWVPTGESRWETSGA